MEYFCKNCFADEYLQELIEKEGEINTCHCCENTNEKCIDGDWFRKLMRPIMNLYQITENKPGKEEITGEVMVGHLWDILTSNWKIFENNAAAEVIIRLLYREKEDMNDNSIIYGSEIDLSAYYGLKKYFDPESNKKSNVLPTKWFDFCNEIKCQKRFFPKNPLTKKVCNKLFEILTKVIAPPKNIFRARMSEENLVLETNKMGKPPKNKSKNGRVNPIGIPCLYLASDEETAIAEIRPFVGSYLTVGQFTIKKPIKMLDLRLPVIHSPFKYGDKLPLFVENLDFLSNLSMELSKPINPNSISLEYLPTQYLSEYIKSLGFDGILYDSSVSGGYNLAIFDDIGKLKCNLVNHYQVTEITSNYKKSKTKFLSGSAHVSLSASMKATLN